MFSLLCKTEEREFQCRSEKRKQLLLGEEDGAVSQRLQAGAV